MSLKQDIVLLLLQHGAKKIMESIAYRDAEKEVLRVNRARFPGYEFHIVPSKHKKLHKLIGQGWRDALIDPEIGRLVHFPQEFLGKKILLFKKPVSKNKIGFVK